MIRNDNPDKGTETVHSKQDLTLLVNGIRNDNPDKGTETPGDLSKAFVALMIRNDNPDKGTETMLTTFTMKAMTPD